MTGRRLDEEYITEKYGVTLGETIAPEPAGEPTAPDDRPGKAPGANPDEEEDADDVRMAEGGDEEGTVLILSARLGDILGNKLGGWLDTLKSRLG